ncbi:hypothetical protein SAMN02745823_02595 [Sporobacter termitidis DSM 10068]|uniref:Uncharacterized protein n=1 Tax=Sporobacter termitidis DSM 10068 TaxID=1123282 RepID=A0A1M5YKL3_9FIRM|nr:hypothetical protein [Sporobacter termitidis]SHI12587.1 hypothetical protein SAMN02745823_02595 [Sporobacter termitidis DSM 10068]
MRTGNSGRCGQWVGEDYGADNIIYLYEQRKPRRTRDTRKADTFWNVIFVAACLSVLVVLFLH